MWKITSLVVKWPELVSERYCEVEVPGAFRDTHKSLAGGHSVGVYCSGRESPSCDYAWQRGKRLTVICAYELNSWILHYLSQTIYKYCCLFCFFALPFYIYTAHIWIEKKWSYLFLHYVLSLMLWFCIVQIFFYKKKKSLFNFSLFPCGIKNGVECFPGYRYRVWNCSIVTTLVPNTNMFSVDFCALDHTCMDSITTRNLNGLYLPLLQIHGKNIFIMPFSRIHTLTHAHMLPGLLCKKPERSPIRNSTIWNSAWVLL